MIYDDNIWINVEQELPKDNTDKLVFTDNVGYNQFTIAYYQNGHWYRNGILLVPNVIAWTSQLPTEWWMNQ